jgi:5-methylcytosine-specific restriction enzyme A
LIENNECPFKLRRFGLFATTFALMKLYFAPASPEHQKREKSKARELRASQWWKQTVGKGSCYHCEQKFKPAELTMDHLIPIARGGKSDKKNCVPSCKDCNTKKGHQTRAEMAMDMLSDSTDSGPNSDSDDNSGN